MRNMKFLPIFIALVLVCLVAEASEPVFVLNTPSGSYPVVRFNHYYWVSFDLKSPVPLQLTSNVAIRSAEISPKSKPVAYNLADNKLNFRLEHPGYHVLRINDSIKVFLFAEKPETPPGNDKAVNIVSNYQVDPTGRNNETAKIQRALDDISGSQKVLFFPRGIYKSEQLKIRSNSRIYL